MAAISVRTEQLSCAANSSVVWQRDECKKARSSDIYHIFLFMRINFAGFRVIYRAV